MTSDSDDTTRRHALQLAAGVAAVAALGTEAAAAVPNVAGVWKLVGGSMTACLTGRAAWASSR
jgi:hypothetical protein